MKTKRHSPFSRRQHMDTADYEVFYYSDRNLAPVKEHTHDYYEFYFFLEGDVTITIKDQQYIMAPNDFLVVPPHTPHFPTMTASDKAYRRFVLWISADYLNCLKQLSAEYSWLPDRVEKTNDYRFANDAITFNAIQAMLFHMIDEKRGNRFGKETAITLQLHSLLLYLNRLVYERLPANTTATATDLLHNLCQYIEEHISDDLSLDLLSERFYINKYYVSHIFKEETGMSIHQFIIKKRLDACKNAILNNEPISTIYLEYGFHDYSNFFRAFKKEYGMSPREFKISLQ